MKGFLYGIFLASFEDCGRKWRCFVHLHLQSIFLILGIQHEKILNAAVHFISPNVREKWLLDSAVRKFDSITKKILDYTTKAFTLLTNSRYISPWSPPPPSLWSRPLSDKRHLSHSWIPRRHIHSFHTDGIIILCSAFEKGISYMHIKYAPQHTAAGHSRSQQVNHCWCVSKDLVLIQKTGLWNVKCAEHGP